MKLLRLTPYLLSLLTAFNVVIQQFTGIPLYAALGIISLFWLAVSTSISLQRMRRLEQNLWLVLYVLHFVFLHAMQIASHTYFGSLTLALTSTFVAVWMITFFLLFTATLPDFDWRRFAAFQIGLGLVVACLGLIQYAFSPNLFGLIPDVRWQDFFVDNSTALRASSVLGSAQVFGFYCALLSIVALDGLPAWKGRYRCLLFIVFVAAGLLSGSRSLVVTVVIYLIMRSTFVARLCALIGVLVLILVVVSLPNLGLRESENVVYRPISWIFDVRQLVENERSVRVARNTEAIRKSDIIWGVGLGSTTPSDGERYITPESLFVQTFVEGGVFPVIYLALFVGTTLWRSAARENRFAYRLTACTGLSWIFVHAFGSPVFFPFWGLLIGVGLSSGQTAQTPAGTKPRRETGEDTRT